MQTGICPECEIRKILVLHVYSVHNDEGKQISSRQEFVVRNHECGAELEPYDVLSLEEAYEEIGKKLPKLSLFPVQDLHAS